MRIGIVAPLWQPLPPLTYGGIERHLYLLVEGLVERGHAITLFASGDSQTHAHQRSVVAHSLVDPMRCGEAYCYEHYVNTSLAEALRESADLDVLHLHLGSSAVPLAELASCSVLHTLHTSITVDDLWIFKRFPETPLIALTRRQIADVPPGRRRRIGVIPHGFDFATCQVVVAPPAHLVFLGRMGPHKGADDAIRIARAAGRPILLAGAPETPDERAWFDHEIKPELDGHDVVWLGAVEDAEKDELFRGAAALVFPIRWDEPFGLVMLEALARGVPVLATPRGSVPEVIEPGLTGFLAESPEALASQVEAAAGMGRDSVREHAMRRFSVPAMVDAYEGAYARARGCN
jgi:glycosyltransferase involved in cell wall biosynthesis